MTYNRGCCQSSYTTRAYDLSGNINWTANYFRNYTSSGSFPNVTCQVVDSSQVYVGGSRLSDGTNYWSLACFDIVTGQFQWYRDLLADVGLSDRSLGLPLCLQIDQNGYIVCMLDPGTYTASAKTQNFVRVKNDGTLIDVISYTTPVLSSQAVFAHSFVVTSGGDYHIAATANGIIDANFYRKDFHILEWLTPFSSPPSDHHIVDSTGSGATYAGGHVAQIIREGNRDYVAMKPELNPSGSSPWSAPSIWRGASGSSAPSAFSSFDLKIFSRPYYAPSAVTAAGTTQGSATALSANTSVNITRSTGNTGVRLPSGSPGDVVCTNSMTPGPTFSPNRFIFPPSGGTITDYTYNVGSVNASVSYNNGDYFVCIDNINWYQIFVSGGDDVYRLAVDTSGNIFCTTFIQTTNQGIITKVASNGVRQWRKGQYAVNMITDSSGNVYSVGKRLSSGATVCARDTNGAWLWGHKHMGCYLNSTNVTGDSPQQTIHMDPDGTQVIVSGCYDDNSFVGPCLKANDLNFVSDPWP